MDKMYYTLFMVEPAESVGKKIFLLHPHSVIKEEMLDLLIMAGYETYTIIDEKRAKKLLAKFPGSIMFINIDEGSNEKTWEKYTKDIMEDPATKASRLGIMSYNQDKVLMKKYLMDMAIHCGYVQLKLGLQESTKIILGALEANEARGRRKYIRAECEDDINAMVNFKNSSGLCHGKILDISSAGIAARFDEAFQLGNSTRIKDVQLKLRGGIVMTEMIYMGLRRDDKHVYIMLFDNKLSTENKLVIHHYIKQCLQKYIDSLRV